ncbi:multidrug effflux MFS transporter [Oceanomicrobium pacificus]|uniref:Bcr/CflA family efflux transporter n=1 Tax=Oceanomicrobium pacificus TaxID=2692916 RepID=A0A6B0TX69_9RHOB|nr:multidrug effflux MFS transporter [Oceanomicrobium pacificus]MXU66078.1 Bcr/CflA family efflux MFS transporter [Oceanomicrobium pacificus]
MTDPDADRAALADHWGFVSLLGGLSALTAFSIDIMMPAAGIIAAELGVPARLGGLIIGVYLLGYAVGQLFWGLLSDAYGRRPALLASLGLFVAASVGCALVQDFTALLVLRVAQGLAAGAPVIARAIVRDIGHGDVAAKLLAVLMAVTAIAPILAPVIGAGLLELFSWRASFVVLALGGIVLLGLSWRMGQETMAQARPERFSLRFVASASRYLFAQRDFLVGMGVSSFTFGGYASVLSLGAVVVGEGYGLSPSGFSAVFALGALFILGGSLFVRMLVGRLGLRRIGTIAAATLGAAVLVHGTYLFVTPGLAAFWLAVCLYMLAFGLVLPSAQAVAIEPAAEMPGFASSLLGALLMLFGAGGAGVAAALFDGTHRAISMTMVLFGAAAIACLVAGRLYDRRRVAGA